MIRKVVFALACLTIFAAPLSAQELNVWLNGGWQGLSYKLQNGKSSVSGGGSIGLGYTFPVTRHWSLIAGLTGGSYGTSAKLDDGSYMYNKVDATGTAFQYNIQTRGYKETQRFFSFGIPVMAQYHTTGSRIQWYVNGGGKFLIPFNANVKASAQSLALSGYYPDLNAELSDLPQHGFGTINGWQGSATTELKAGAALDAETGVSFALSAGVRLYTGLYLEYGLTDLRGHNEVTSFLQYDPNGITDVPAGSVLDMPSTGSARVLAFGVTVRLGLEHFSIKPKNRHASEEAPQQPLPVDTVHAKAQEQAAPESPKPQTQAVEPTQPVQPTKPVEAVAAAKEPAKPAVEWVRRIQEPVVFAVLNKTSVPDGLKLHLDSVADNMKNYPDLRIAIIGHTCSIGTEQENMKVGEERAQAVAKYLQDKGIDASRMDIRSDGEANPAFPNDTASNRSRNRMVTIEVLDAD